MSATIKPFTDEFEEYGRDESRASGEASSISFPTTEDEVRAILEKLHAERVPVTVQGARTGLAAAMSKANFCCAWSRALCSRSCASS